MKRLLFSLIFLALFFTQTLYSQELPWQIDLVHFSVKEQSYFLYNDWNYRYFTLNFSNPEDISSLEKIGNERTEEYNNGNLIGVSNRYQRYLLKLKFESLEQAFTQTYQVVESLLKYNSTIGYLDSDFENIPNAQNGETDHLSILLVKNGRESYFTSGNDKQKYEAFDDTLNFISLTDEAPMESNSYELNNNNEIKDRIEDEIGEITIGENKEVVIYIALRTNSEDTKLYCDLTNLMFSTTIQKKHEFSNTNFSGTSTISNSANSPSMLTANGINYLSGNTPFLGLNEILDIKTNNQRIGSFMHRRWNYSDDIYKLAIFGINNRQVHQSLAQFDTPTKLTIQSTFVETVPGVSSGFEFKDPWLVEPDGQTQANSYKSYSGTKQFEVFRNTNNETEKINSQPTYLLKAGAVSQNGIEFFELSRDASNAQLIPTGVSGEEIVSLSNNNAIINRTYKAKNHSTVSNVVGLDNRRLLVEEPVQGYLYRTYESANRIWVQFRPKNSPDWSNEFMLPLPFEDDNGDGINDALDDNGYDEIAFDGYI